MPTKQNIIDNVAEYTPAELAGFIREGIVSFAELCEESEFSAKARREVKALTQNSEEEDWQKAYTANTTESYDLYLTNYPEGKYREKALRAKNSLADTSLKVEIDEIWEKVDKNNLDSLNDFVDTYPDSPMAQQALEIIAGLARQRYMANAKKELKREIEEEANPKAIIDIIEQYLEDGGITHKDIYEGLVEDPNWLPALVVKQLQARHIIDFNSLEARSGVPRSFFDYMNDHRLDDPVIDVVCDPIRGIGRKNTEIYFWGIPSSGKTCALGAILSEAQHGGYVDYAAPQMCQGYHYMTMLSQTFNGRAEVFKLPEGTATDAIFEMEFVLKKDRKDYPVTFIDLAGETIDSMYRRNAGLPLTTAKESGLNTALSVLQGNPKENRKVHFFVIEYDGHDKMYNGLTQYSLLDGALAYIRNTGILRTETDAIYLLVTKADLTKATDNAQREERLREYLSKHYRTFYNGLRNIAQENEINGGEVDIIPFSVGQVCFQNLCLFNNQDAATVVRLILERSTGFKTGKLANIVNRLNS